MNRPADPLEPSAVAETERDGGASPHRVLVVDDERPARAKLKRLLARDPRFSWAGEARDGIEALERIEELKPDLVLLDVQMPGCDGFEMLSALGREPEFAVVFVTAHDAHALRAFDARALDYLLKPYDQDRLAQALDKVHRQLLGGSVLRRSLNGLLAALAPETQRYDRLVIKTREGWKSVLIASIVRLSASGKYVELTEPERKHLVRASLQSFEERLKGHGFVRVHRGEIVRPSAVVQVESLDHGDAVLTLLDGSAVSLSRTCRAEFFRHFAGPAR